MKKNVKRILPILLAIVILASVFWYLFIYDRNFTRDILVQGARFFEDQGKHSIAAWFYDRAYDQSNGDDAVAIELAEHFRQQGNYTQAEITLSRAISEGATPELYIALSQTFVEQDKLLDAVTMLDNIADASIRQQIAALRPAAPTATPEQNFHNEVIPVELTANGGKLYLTIDGTYPSTANGASNGKLMMDSGETIIRALIVGENGLVSPLATFNYTIIDVIREVTFTDATIEAAVRNALEFDPTAAIFSSDLWTISELTLPQGADSYLDLANLPYLQKLTIEGGTAATLEGINSLTALQELTIRNASLRTADLLIVASLPNLQKLTLAGCGLSSIDNLAQAKNLQYLDLSDNSIRDFTALSFLAGLTYLDLSHNALTDLNAASAMTGLQTLKVAGNSLTSLSPISGCTGLKELDVGTNAIYTLSGIETLTGLEVFNASSNALTDVLPLSGLTGLKTLDISENELTDITCLSGLNALEFFYFQYNQVTALPEWSVASALITIDGSHNQISSLKPLYLFQSLNYVLMEDNNITSVADLVYCSNLIKVNVYDNPITDVSALTKPGEHEQSIIVIWNPLG